MPRSMRWATAPAACALRLRCHRPTPVPDARRPNVCMPSAICARLCTSRVHASRLSRIAVQLLNTSVFVRYCRSQMAIRERQLVWSS